MSNPVERPPFERAYPPARPASGPTLYLPFRGSEVVLAETESGFPLHPGNAGPGLLPPLSLSRDGSGEEGGLYLGTLHGVPCLTYRMAPDAPLPPHYRAVGLRALYGQVDDAVYGLAGYASEIVHWWEDHRFCSHCGGELASLAARKEESGWGKECPNCGRSVYPPVVPAILLLIHDGGDRVLMVTKPGWGTRFSIVAGFVEPGESLEGCCEREAMEEVGVAITDIRYQGSQPWPFPHQIMLGFTARYVGGDIRLDEKELADARWFDRSALPDLPPALSLSRQIIDAWTEKRSR